MRGIIFTEYLEFLEKKFDYDLVDQVLSKAQLPSGGIYTSVGAYDFSEMVELLTKTCEITEAQPGEILQDYGKHVLAVFYKGYPSFFDEAENAFDFLMTIDDKIHPQVLKLYPDAELPKFDAEVSGNTMIMVYNSSRSMGDFALGLIEGCLEHFGEVASVKKEKLDEAGSKVRFTITK